MNSILFVFFLSLFAFILSLDYSKQNDTTEWYGTCSSRESQSPIDLPNDDDCIQSKDFVKILSTNYPKINDKQVSFVHGYSFAIEFEEDEGKEALTVDINGTILTYDITNIHFHFLKFFSFYHLL